MCSSTLRAEALAGIDSFEEAASLFQEVSRSYGKEEEESVFYFKRNMTTKLRLYRKRWESGPV
jgi:hypothetical protein